MLVVLALLVLAAAAVLLSGRSRGSRVQVRSCCSARAWPPDDLTRDASAR